MGSHPQSSAFTPPIHHILLFGDLTYDFRENLLQILYVKGCPSLADFFARLHPAIRNEIASIPRREQEWFPQSTDLVELVDNMGTTQGTPVMRFALLCVYQLGRFLNHFGKPSSVYPTKSILVSLCTGSFAAAAIATSSCVADVVPAGVEAVVYAFRTALHSFRLAKDMETTSLPQSWSSAVSLPTQQAADLIQQYVMTKAIPKRHSPFVSTVNTSNVTISGPAAVVNDFLVFSNLQFHPLPVQSPFHAPHLSGDEDVDRVLARPINEIVRASELRIPWISSAATLIENSNFESVIRRAVHDTLCEQVRIDKIVELCAALAFHPAPTIIPCASSCATKFSKEVNALQDRTLRIDDALNASVRPSPGVSTRQIRNSKIAIVGFSGRFPDASSNEKLWELLRAGIDTHRTVPEDRFDWKAHYDASEATRNTSRVKYGCFVREPGHFDAPFFRMSPTEAKDTDPAQRLALMTTYEALEMAGFVTDRTPSSQRNRVGVFFGTTSDDWREVNSSQDVGTYFIPGGNRAFIPGRITFFYRFSGPSISVDTACSSSFTALHVACQSLWQGECDTAISGGTNILTNPDNFAGLSRGHFLSTTGNCNPFDDEASGYCRADAVASLVLKRLEDAEEDQDPIFGVIRTVDTNHCGQTVSITRPHQGDQLALFRRIFRNTNTNPLDISYVEMHGTGTQAGDAAEMSSVLSIMAPDRKRIPGYPLYLGALKANIGHSESASGVSALIKVLMMFRHNEIPPHIGIKNKLNRHYPLDLQQRNVHIASKPTSWKKLHAPIGKRVSLLNNFSAAGGNTAVLLEDAPSYGRNKSSDPRPSHLISVTGNSTKSLQGNMQALLAFLNNDAEVCLPALSYTTTARRFHYRFRASFAVADIPSLKSAIMRRVAEDDGSIPPLKGPRRIVFMFSGQGQLYVNLGKSLFQDVPSFNQDLVRFDRISQQHGFTTFLPLVSSDTLQIEQVDTSMAHLGVACIQMALSNLLVSWGITPSLLLGHSLGEYPALYAAGVLSASDTIYLVGTRSQLVSSSCERGTHSMLVARTSATAVKRAITPPCEVACFNSPTNTTISGPTEDIKHAEETLRAEGVECISLNLPYAFHSEQVESWSNQYQTAASNVEYRAPKLPYISPLLARTVMPDESGILNASYLSRASRNPVDFAGAIASARDEGLLENTTWIEIGTHPACSNFVGEILGPQTKALSTLRKSTDPWRTLIPAVRSLYLDGTDINWNEYHKGFSSAHKVLQLPTYDWDLKNYWIMYRGNFCLTKGDTHEPVRSRKDSPPELVLSSSVHRVLEEQNGIDKSNLLAESDIHDERLYPILRGHQVCGASLCPSSQYADMAFTIARYMLQANRMSSDLGLDCTDMKIDRPLVANPCSKPQLLRVTACADWTLNNISMSFFTLDRGSQRTSHATCTIQITQAPAEIWLQQWKRTSHLIRGRISSLRKGVEDGDVHRLKRGLAYRLFSSIVTYENRYQGMSEVVLNSRDLEATAQVTFQVGDEGFYWNPCWIDSLGHIAGFVMNSNEYLESTEFVYVNHGWSNMRCASRFEYGKTYQTYNKMHPEDDKGRIYTGDTYILEDDTVVAIFEGVRFQRVPRAALESLLPSKAPLAPTRPTNGTGAPAEPLERSEITRKQSCSATAQDEHLSRLRTVISEVAGVNSSELNAETHLGDIGIDSLMSLTISSRLRANVGIDLPSSVFVEHPTLGDIVTHLTDIDSNTGHDDEQRNIKATPANGRGMDENNDTDHTPADGTDVNGANRLIFAQGAGLLPGRIQSSANPTDLAMDPLAFLTVRSKANELGIGIPPATCTENPALESICKATYPETDTPSQSPTTSPSTHPRATSVALQGTPSSSKTTLFLIPDGAGVATSYTSLPPIPGTLTYGLNCPWLKDPDSLPRSLPTYVSPFVQEIRRRQPEGPYNLGGWSAGGILAYEAAQQLAHAGYTTSNLILLDCPDPIGIQSPPQRMYDFLEERDMFGMKGSGRKAPSWLRPHFSAFIDMLDRYRAVPFRSGKTPTTHMIYARDGICKNPRDPRPEMREDDPREMRWLLDNRTDFSGGGWRDLVGERAMRVSVVEGVNHYTLMADRESMKRVSRIIAEALDDGIE